MGKGIAAFPGMDVGKIHADSVLTQQRLAWTGFSGRHIFDPEDFGTAIFVNSNCFRQRDRPSSMGSYPLVSLDHRRDVKPLNSRKVFYNYTRFRPVGAGLYPCHHFSMVSLRSCRTEYQLISSRPATIRSVSARAETRSFRPTRSEGR